MKDGTLWALVQGTNPEVLLLVESRLGGDNTLRWNYAFAAMTSYPAEAKRIRRQVGLERRPSTHSDTGYAGPLSLPIRRTVTGYHYAEGAVVIGGNVASPFDAIATAE